MVVDVLRRLNDIQRLAVERLMDVAEQVDGARPLSDHLWLDFVADHSPTYVGLLLPVHPNDADAAKPVDLAGYAQLQQNNGVWSLAVVIEPQHRSDVAPLIKLVERAVTYTAEHHGGTINWWVPTHVGNEFEAAVAAHGFHLARELHQMRRPLPLTQTTDLVVRAFEPGSDEADWLVVNNRAFSTHPEQGGWNIAALAQRQMEPWFDPEGFLLHERDGVLAGFCWTKVHTEIDPPVGEIYAIGVDPAFHGLGLGKALTVAGLEHLAARGLSEAMLYVDAANTTATGMYTRLGFIIDHTDRAFQADVAASEQLPTWSVADVHESFTARSFLDAMERADADATRLTAMFDHLNIRATTARAVSEADGEAADRVIQAYNDALAHLSITGAFVHAAVSTNSYDAHAQGVASELDGVQARLAPLMARLAEWVAALGVDQLALVSEQVAENTGPLSRLAARAERQMSESEEGLYAELRTTGSSAWQRLHSDVTSQLEAAVSMPDGTSPVLPMAAVRGLATHSDPAVRRAAYEAEMAAWPGVAVACAAAMNGIKGEANIVNRRRGWQAALDASLFANSVSRDTFEAMNEAIDTSLDDMRGWMRCKAGLHHRSTGEGTSRAADEASTIRLAWSDLVAPLPFAPASISWDEGLDIVRNAFGTYGGTLAGLVDRAVDERWIDAASRPGKRGGAFCMPFVGDRSLVFLNWSGSVDSAQTTAHELGHAYHNTQLVGRTPLQRQLPMALAETASIFCETLVVEEGLGRLEGRERLALLDVDLQGTNQVIVDIRSRFLFETAVFAARRRRTVGVDELNELMRAAQAEAYGDGLDQATAHPYMWAVKPHYYGSHFYNWPYTYGLLFGLGLFAQYRADPDGFRVHYDDVLSRVGMCTAEELAAAFGFDVTSVGFWTSSLDVVRDRIAQYRSLASEELR